MTLFSFCRVQGLRIAVASLILGSLLGCSGVQKLKPTELGPNTPLIAIRAAWTNDVGSVSFPLQVKVVGTEIYVASSAGQVVSIDGRTGQDVWRASLGEPLSAGVGSDGEYVSVVTKQNQIITLTQGKEIWRQKISAVVFTAPFVAGGRVFVLSSDRSVSAFDAKTGRRLWKQQRDGDSLVLGQASAMMAVGDTLVMGVGGRLIGMNPQNGDLRWDVVLANSRGTNEVERLVDIVAGAHRHEDRVCVRSFQTAVGCVDAVKGRLLWSKPASGSTGIHGDNSLVVGTESDGQIYAWRMADGERIWSSERLKYRKLSAPIVVGRSIAIGDDSGSLHFLSKIDGEPLNRMTTDGSAIIVAPTLVGQTLVAITQRGGIFGFKPD